MRSFFVVLAAVSLAGCSSLPPIDTLRPFARDDGPSRWSVETDPAMAPDFSRQGPTYPVLLVHQHHVPSEREREGMRNVVCQEKDGRPLLPFRPSMDMAMTYCEPVADPATGRVFIEREEMRARGAEALAIVDPSCTGGIVFLGKERREFVVSAPGHDFLVRLLPEGGFEADGIPIAAGSALKISYYLHDASDRDREFVRVVFEAPGEWLHARVTPSREAPGGPPRERDIPARPDQGTGLAVEVPLDAASFRAPFEAVVAATPAETLGVAALRAVRDTHRFTEFTISLVTRTGTVTWFGVQREGRAMTLYGAEDPAAEDAGVPRERIEPLLDLTWSDLRGGTPALLTDVRLANDTAWASAGLVPLAAPAAAASCDEGCVLVRQGDAWESMLAPRAVPAEGAATLHVLAFGAEVEAQRWWHVPDRADISLP